VQLKERRKKYPPDHSLSVPARGQAVPECHRVVCVRVNPGWPADVYQLALPIKFFYQYYCTVQHRLESRRRSFAVKDTYTVLLIQGAPEISAHHDVVMFY